MRKATAFFLVMTICMTTVFGQTNQIILKLKSGSDTSNHLLNKQGFTGNNKIDNLSSQLHAVKVQRLFVGKKSNSLVYTIRFSPGSNIQQVINEYYKTGEVNYAEPDYAGSGDGQQGITPNDQLFYRQWSLHNDGTFSLSHAVAGADIDMDDAWTIEQGDSNIVVGIIDSGDKLDHPEFSGRIWTNHKEIPNNGIDDDGNGFVDDVNGWNFAYNTNDPTDDYGHGTNVSGIIGANGNNSIGYAGVDWNCKLMILKGLDSTDRGFYSWWAQAVYYAVDNGARVINMSLEGNASSTTLQDAMDYADSHNVLVVVCMGNENSSTPDYPAACNHVMAIGSTNPDDTRTDPFFWSATSGSNYGNHISVVAPGNYIYGLNNLSNTDYSWYWGGTSQATPHVTALASLLLAQNSNRTPTELKSIIESTAEDQVGNLTEDTPGWDQYYGYGRINAYKALSYTTGISSTGAKDQAVSIFPNPSNGNFFIQFPSSTMQIQIFNSLGQLLQIKNVKGLTTENFELAEDGIYFIQITADKQTVTEKLIVSK